MAGKPPKLNPYYLIDPFPGERTQPPPANPVDRAMEYTAPTGYPGTVPDIKTYDDLLSLGGQANAVKDLMRQNMVLQATRGETDEEAAARIERDQPGFFSTLLETVSKPFRYETSVATAPLVAAIRSWSLNAPDEGFTDFWERYKRFYPQLQKEAALGERELSVYDALKESGMADLGAVPLGLMLDIMLSPSTYLGIGAPTKLGKVARAVTAAERAGETISESSKIGKLVNYFAKEGPEALKLGGTAAEQAARKQKALISFAGKPVMYGEGVFRELGKMGEAIKDAPGIGTALYALRPGLRPKGMDPEKWEALQDMFRTRRGRIGLRSKDFLKEIKELALKTGLSEDELTEVFYALERKGVPEGRLPLDKLTYTEVAEPTALSALRAKGARPGVSSLAEPEFIQAWREAGAKPGAPLPSYFINEAGDIVARDPGQGWARRTGLERRLQNTVEGERIFDQIPKKWQPGLKKVYGDVPDKAKFAEDWARFSAGNPVDPGVERFFGKLSKKGGHKAIPGVVEITHPSGQVIRVVGDLKFANEAQETVRQFAKAKFSQLLQEEKGIGILNKGIEDYVNRIYQIPAKIFRPGKELSYTPGFTKTRGFRDIVQAEEAGYEPLTNILEVVGIRGQKSIEAQESKRLLDEAAELFGVIPDGDKMSNDAFKLLADAGIDPDNKKAVTAYLRKERMVPMKIGDNEYWFHKDVHDALSRVVEPFASEEITRKFWQMYDRSLNVWKGYVTAVNPKFHARNFMGNNYLLWIKDGWEGLNPLKHKMARDILKENVAGQILTDTGKVISYDEIRKLLSEYGMMGSGLVGGELKEAFRHHLKLITKGRAYQYGRLANPLRSQNAAIAAGRWFGTHVENEAKVVGFINDLMKFGDPAYAARNTFSYLYDYMDLTNFEKTHMKRLIPFWTWMSRNIPNMFKTLVTQPAKVGIPAAKVPMVFEHRTKRELRERGISFPDALYPESVRETASFPLGMEEMADKIAMHSPSLPYADINRLGLRELLSAITPPLKATMEQVAPWEQGGYSIWTDRPYERYKGELVPAPLGTSALPDFIKNALGVREGAEGESYVPGQTAAIINTLLPMLRTPQKLLDMRPGQAPYTVFSEILGQRAFPLDPALERRSSAYEIQDALRSLGKVEKGLSRRTTRRAAEERDLTLKDLIDLYMIRYGTKYPGRR